MPTPGKNFPGQRGFPTPNSTPDDTVRRIFIVPNSDEWLGLLEGAVQVLLDEWRYYDWGAMTPAEAASAFNSIVLASYTNLCQCELPGGGSVIRLNPDTGHLEELGDDGTWVEPSGDYAVPPITPREGGTAEDQMCLAAANAAHVLELLYESVTDSIAESLTEAEAYTAMVEAFILAVGWEFAPIAFAIGTFFLIVFGVLYAIVALIGADLWDETFTRVLVCALVGCASNDAGVVTFDWTCTQSALAATTDALDFNQLRLFGQLSYLIEVIGGADGLNQAGATTAITDYDCSPCFPTGWCYFWDFTLSDGGWVVGAQGEWSDGVGWVSQTVSPGVYDVLIYAECPGGCGQPATTVTIVATWTPGSGIEGDTYIAPFNYDGGSYDIMAPLQTMASGTHSYVFDVVAYGAFNALAANCGTSSDVGGSMTIQSVQAEGDSTAPIFSGGSDCS